MAETTTDSESTQSTLLKSGDIVAVRSFEEIRTTLDHDGMLEGVPFMPEMQQYCGRVFKVYKRTDKICVEREYLDFRRLKNAVMLEDVRCDGSAHDGCRKLCMIFWKEAWLRRAPAGSAPEAGIDWVSMPMKEDYGPVDESKSYSCQSTNLLGATERLPIWDIRQYVRELRVGTYRFGDLFQILFLGAYNYVASRKGRKEYGAVYGVGTKTPSVSLGLRKGDLVRVKSAAEIATTLDANGKNRGLYFAYDMARHCGRALPVITPVDRMILENTGKMKKLTNTVLLRGGECTGLCHRGCARFGHPLWREAWLEPVEKAGSGKATSA